MPGGIDHGRDGAVLASVQEDDQHALCSAAWERDEWR
jgi:hypothetical protein